MASARSRVATASANFKPAPRDDKSPAESIKDTIDSIIVALALALAFRAFVVEAFVIPTGSMAITLLGQHRHFVCPLCGSPFDVSVDNEGNKATTDKQLEENARFLLCPRCTCPLVVDNQSKALYNPDCGGDKILVFKFPYLFGHQPDRWDVVVFYNPANPEQNFIKRLIGRPGEAIQILDGKVFVREVGKKELEIQRKPPIVQDALWRPVFLIDYQPPSGSKNPPDNVLPGWRPDLADGSSVATAAAGSAGWSFRDRLDEGPPASTEAKTRGRVAHYQPAGSQAQPERIVFHSNEHPADGDSRSGSPSQLNFLDYLPYNNTSFRDWRIFNVVWDLKLQFVVRFAGPGGVVSASLNHRIGGNSDLSTPGHIVPPPEERFTAKFHQAGLVELFRSVGGVEEPKPVRSATLPAPFPIGQGVAVAIQNVDYRVSVFVNGHVQDRLTFDRAVPLRTLQDYALRDHRNRSLTAADVPAVWIEAAGSPLDLLHVSLYRDVYYTSHMDNGRISRGSPGSFEPQIELKKHQPDRDDPNDEFFVMGDNSLYSSDGRVWNDKTGPYWHLQDRIAAGLYQYGRVPRDHLIGRAFFVYWPAALGELPIALKGIRYIPNIGQMRLIH